MRSDRQIVVLVGEMPIEILFKRKDFRALFVAHAVAKGPAELKERQSPRNRWRHAKGAVAVCRFEVCKAARRRAGEPRTVDWGSGERLKEDRLLHARW